MASLKRELKILHQLPNAFYSKHHSVSCRKRPKTGAIALLAIIETQQSLLLDKSKSLLSLDTIDLEGPIVQLALILTSVLSIPSPLPWRPGTVEEGTIFANHEKDGREKDRWCTVLFLKMMWFRHRELAVPEFIDCLNKKQGESQV